MDDRHGMKDGLHAHWATLSKVQLLADKNVKELTQANICEYARLQSHGMDADIEEEEGGEQKHEKSCSACERVKLTLSYLDMSLGS